MVEPGLAEHYRDEVIGGHGAFMIAIDDYEGFAEAIQRKLAERGRRHHTITLRGAA